MVTKLDSGTYHVRSRSRDQEHFVSLFERDGAGICDCEHFQYTCNKPYETPEQARCCWHIRQAREAFYFEIVGNIMAEMKKQK